ncbi:MAG: carboxypeptidase-like regulatory domain-containing protein, partial [Candidatus Polarisedimenticolia bacterium]
MRRITCIDGVQRKIAILAAASCVYAAAGMAPAWAQEDNQRCEGTVTDDKGQPMEGVTISFLELDFNRPAQPVKTNKKGKYAHNVLRASTGGGYEIRATKEGLRILQISAHTTREDGTPVTNHDVYMVGFDQKGLHKVLVPPQARSSANSRGRCVVDFVMAPEDTFNQAYQAMKAAKGEAKPAAGGLPGAPAAPAA